MDSRLGDKEELMANAFQCDYCEEFKPWQSFSKEKVKMSPSYGYLHLSLEFEGQQDLHKDICNECVLSHLDDLFNQLRRELIR